MEKRIDIIATAIQFRGTVNDLAEAELRNAPQLGAAKDPVNLAGMLAENVLNGEMHVPTGGRSIAPMCGCSTCKGVTSTPTSTSRTRSIGRSRRCAAATLSCRRIGTSGPTAVSDNGCTSPPRLWRSMGIAHRICLGVRDLHGIHGRWSHTIALSVWFGVRQHSRSHGRSQRVEHRQDVDDFLCDRAGDRREIACCGDEHADHA